MAYAFGKDQVSIGSAPDNDVVLAAQGVAPHHARLVRQGAQLFFVDLGVGPSAANNAPIAPQHLVPFDFRTVFTVGGVPVPLAHGAIACMLISGANSQRPRAISSLGATRAVRR